MAAYDPKQIEEKVNDFWSRTKTPETIAAFKPATKKKFYLLDGPPYANGHAHAGHALTITFKDVWGKFKTMQGFDVWWQPGFDCHGLPIENKVQQAIGVTSKADIEKYGVDKFMARCREFAVSNLKEWMVLYKRMAAWKGWLEPYLTYEDSYIESGWWTVRTLHEKGMLYRGKKPIHWCAHCETALAGYEASDEYRDVEDPAVYAKFKVHGRDESILVWTTTPWTLPSNVALLVHPEEKYVRVRAGNETLIMAKALLKTVMEKADTGYTILEEFPGKKLEGTRYESLIDCPLQKELAQNKNALRVYLSVPIMLKKVASKVAEKKGTEAGAEHGHLVTMDTGTGIVHIAPGHGEEDNKIGERYKLPALSPLDDRCHFTEGAGFRGYVKDADPKIVEYLRVNGKLFRSERLRHSYPHCWRCKSPLIFRLSEQWFLSIDAIKEKMLSANKHVRWLPEFAQERMANLLTESPDWCISTQRYWGIPLPIWICEKCGKYDVIGGKNELEKRMVSKAKLADLHKNVVDHVKIKCGCKGTMSRVPDTMTVWIDSGIGPWASLGYPHKNKALFEKLWNVDLIDESQDQIRGWFYALLFMGVATFDESPYRTVCLNGWVLDARGEKMSKSLGNVVDAGSMVNELGADVLRLYLCSASAPWGVYKFSFDEAKKLHAYVNILLNLKNFVDMYGLKLQTKGAVKGDANKWIVSRTNKLVRDVTDDMENFRFHYAGRKLADFILNDFSRTYMKMAKAGDPEDVGKAVGIVLDAYLRLLAPVCPYVSEYVYQELFGGWKSSIHTGKWPRFDGKLVNEELEKAFGVLDALSESALSLRQDAGIGLRYPISALVVSGPNDLTDSVLHIEDIVKGLLNVKDVRVGKTSASYEIKLNYATAGPKFGKDVRALEAELAKANAGHIARDVSKKQAVKVGEFELAPEDLRVIVKSSAGRAFATDAGVGVVEIDTTETQEVREESFVRELARAVQQSRKEMGMKMTERVVLHVRTDAKTTDVLKRWESTLAEGTGASHVLYDKPLKKPLKCAFKGWSVEFEAVR